MAKQLRRSTAKKTKNSAATKSRATASKARKVSGRSSRNQEALLLVGTMKGAFVLRSDKSRKKWKIEGPHFRGEAVYALLHDTRGDRPRTFAATNSMHWGPTLRTSNDNGATWSEPGPQTVRFPADSGRALAQIWQIASGRRTERDVFTAVSSPPRYSSRATEERAGSPIRDCSTTSISPSGNQAAEGFACTRLSSILTIRDEC